MKLILFLLLKYVSQTAQQTQEDGTAKQSLSSHVRNKFNPKNYTQDMIFKSFQTWVEIRNIREWGLEKKGGCTVVYSH